MGNLVMVAGAGQSGIAATKLLLEVGGEVLLYDGNSSLDIEEIKENFDEKYAGKIKYKFGILEKADIKGVTICVISPGIDLENKFVTLLDDANIQIWSEIQLGFSLAKGKLIAITGTNGKTTTTALVGEIIKAYFTSTFTVGNIGIPYTSVALETKEESVTVLEASSFQLETIIDFRPHVSAILNITPDHLNRHHTMENYVRIKEDITLNQTKEDFCVLNYEDALLREFGERVLAKVIYFSSKRKLNQGIYLHDGIIYESNGISEKKILEVSQLQLLGNHNYENVMAAIAICLSMQVPIDVIRESCYHFHAVAHRIEFVKEKYGVRYYDDSKGTNPDAAIMAIHAMPGPILLIAGGYDKGSDYTEWVESFEGRVKYLVLLGQTKDAIADVAKAHGFSNIMYAQDMEEAVKVCASYADSGDYVLLSPACASWGMFKNYEERGDIFKSCVHAL